MKKMVIALGIIIVLAWAFAAQRGSPTGNLIGDGVIYKSASCGCCSIWASHIDGTGIETTVINTERMDAKKDDLGIPSSLRSCHTMTVGKYFVEGHIPEETIIKLLEEQPDIAGIAMPGMPSGSPGMPGPKQGPFIVYAVHGDGSYEEFMRI